MGSFPETFNVPVLTTPENTATYHNTLCWSLLNFAETLSSVSLGSWNGPKRNWKQCLCKILGGQTKSIMGCYGVFWSGQLSSSVKTSLKEFTGICFVNITWKWRWWSSLNVLSVSSSDVVSGIFVNFEFSLGKYSLIFALLVCAAPKGVFFLRRFGLNSGMVISARSENGYGF